MDDLRALLLLLGGVILAGIVWAHRKRTTQPRHQADFRTDPRSHGQEPTLDDPRVGTEGDGDGDSEYRQAPIQPGLKGLSPGFDEFAEVITLYVRAKHGQPITGPALSDAATRAGLSFGEMNIYHRRQEGLDQPVFSMANLVAPGDFNPDDWASFQTPGVSLFAQLPGPISALDCWDSMLATATRLTELLDAEILDANRVLLSRKRVGEIREQMRQLDRETGFLSDDE